MKAEVDPQPGLVKVEAKLESGDDVPSTLLKEEEGLKRETKDEIPSAMVRYVVASARLGSTEGSHRLSTYL